jgi:hypothetical protein
MLVAASCSDATSPTDRMKPKDANKQLQYTDWYSCSRKVTETVWNCEYTGYTVKDIAGWADFPSAPQYTSLNEVKETSSPCPSCPTGSNNPDGPHAYPPRIDASDAMQRRTRPDCRFTQTDPRDQAWCKAGAVLLPGRKKRIQAVLNNMTALGGECANLAAVGQVLLDAGWIHVYEPGPDIAYTGGGAAPMGAGTDGFILLSRNFTDFFFDKDHASMDYTTKVDGASVTFKAQLQFALAHEIDHLLNRPHLDPKIAGGLEALTENALSCAG